MRTEPAAGKGRKGRTAEEVTGARICAWIEKRCFVPEGKLAGKPMRLLPFQRRLISDIYDNPEGTRRAIVSFGRKNGKTALAACLMLNHLCGPSSRRNPNSQLYSAAQSRDQAALLFNYAAKMVRMNPDLAAHITIRETAKELIFPALGTKYRALSAEATTAYGLSPAFILHDELGQVRGPRSPLYEALETATGAQESPLSVIISTQAPTDADLLSVLIDDALAGHDSRTVVCLHTAPVDANPFDEATIRLANPAFGEFLSADEVLAMAKDAERMPPREGEYRNLILNQRIQADSLAFPQDIWKACGAPIKPLKGLPVYAGLDLSEVADLTALVLIGNVEGVWQVEPICWLPREGLEHKAVADRVPYDLWMRQGYLHTTPGKTVSYEYVAQYLRGVFERYDVRKLAFDRWNMKHLRPWLVKAGFSEQMLEERFVDFGQGFQSMSPALRDLEEIVLERKLAHGNHPVLSMCAAHAVFATDDAGNRKLSKRKSVGRIDAMVALTMACGVAPLKDQPIDIEALIG